MWSGKNHDSVEIMLVAFPTNDEKTDSSTNTNNVDHKLNNAIHQLMIEDNIERV